MTFSTFRRGFSLIELIVSTAIMATIMTLVISGQSNYTSGTALHNAANDLSLAMRQAQIYGISVKKDVSTGSFSSGFGVDFNTANPTLYTFFADKDPKNGTLDSGEALNTTGLPLGDKINKLCVIKTDQSEVCGANVDISFVRPAIQAVIKSNFYNGAIIGARVELSTPDGSLKRSVTLYSTGQISVQ